MIPGEESNLFIDNPLMKQLPLCLCFLVFSVFRLAAAALQLTTQLSGDEDEDDYAFKVSLNPKPGTPAIERRGEMPKP